MNMLDYANFEKEHYEPSKFRDVLVQEAKGAYKDYTEGRIIELDKGLQVETRPETVAEYFSEALSQIAKGFGGQIFEDVNYPVILDDLMLFVDENNIALKNKTLH